MPDLQAPRGMHDTLPAEAPTWRFIRDTAERVARLYDYRFIQTALVEDARVFLRTVGDESDIVQKEMYLFEDRGGDRLALAPEGTASICRSYIEHGMASWPQPVRLFYLRPFFRYDRPQAGRQRQFHQFGVELIGSDAPAADVEVIDLQRTFYEALGLDDLVLRINSIGTAETRRRYVATLHDYFRPHLASLSVDSQRRFETNVLRILDSKEEQDREAVAAAPSILDHLDEADAEHFADVQRFLDATGIDYVVDPHIVRGLDYYARTVWEFEPPETAGQSTVGAGGRYDGLIELLGGAHTPATGFATGIERIALNLERRGLAPSGDEAVDVVTVPMGDAGAAAALRVARDLRAADIVVRAGLPGRSMKAALRGASAANAAFALIIGDREAAEGVAQLKPLRSDEEQRTVALDDVVEAVRTALG